MESHLYYFRGFCSYLKPKYTFLVDIGTRAMPNSISKLYDYMEQRPEVGGCCGEIEVDVRNFRCWRLSDLLVAAQYVEYKISHFLDKAFECVFGFVSVLPGAFCVFRWTAIEGDPLDKYFEGLDKDAEDYDCFKANMYLAEDRIMCLEILIKKKQKNTLSYVPGVRAVTDPPKEIDKFIKQRRRWINGSNFASIYVLKNFGKINMSAHHRFRKISIFILFLYYILNTLLTFCLVGSFYAAFSILVRNALDYQDPKAIYSIANNLENIYILMLFLILMLSLCKDVEKSLREFKIMIFLFGCFMFYTLFTSLQYFFIKKQSNFLTLALVIGIAASYIVPPIINICSVGNVLAFVFGYIAYLFLTPLYVNVFVIYAFANIHDVTWGNRDSAVVFTKDKEFRSYRTTILIVWLLLNIALAYIINHFNRITAGKINFIMYFSIYIGIIVFSKVIGAVINRILYGCKKCFKRRTVRHTLRNIIPPKPDGHPGLAVKDIELLR